VPTDRLRVLPFRLRRVPPRASLSYLRTPSLLVAARHTTTGGRGAADSPGSMILRIMLEV